ncbi:hypothetical protein OVY01_22705 [Robbsia sp. Bb-Pol-6]|uniref:Uncharacterized protein n=1 Tax=Robbsia betulipollinis TaxID=2981849 RepID=A0ABT3ZTZ1_9BURK|nr:hypothetical protein [Robbsia betulipollinis]MCY0389952.1 hypothetical protein [Robbsia betulipollinis]
MKSAILALLDRMEKMYWLDAYVSDWVAIGKATSEPLLDVLRKKRHAALLKSLNHVLPLSVRKESVALAMLEKRWDEPRVKVYAGVYRDAGYFAWDPRTLPIARNGDLALQLRHGFGGRSLRSDAVALFEVPRATWFTAAWDFIEQNSLLVEPDMTPAERATYRRHTEERAREHEERWFVTLPAQRWLQETRRVARWAAQARPVRREVVREQAKAKRQAMLDERLAVVKGSIGVVML